MRVLDAAAMDRMFEAIVSIPERIAWTAGVSPMTAIRDRRSEVMMSAADEIARPAESSLAPADVSARTEETRPEGVRVPSSTCMSSAKACKASVGVPADAPPVISCTRTDSSGTCCAPSRSNASGGGAVTAVASNAEVSFTRNMRMRSHERRGTPSGVKSSKRSATATTAHGMFHDLPQIKRTRGGRL